MLPEALRHSTNSSGWDGVSVCSLVHAEILPLCVHGSTSRKQAWGAKGTGEVT